MPGPHFGSLVKPRDSPPRRMFLNALNKILRITKETSYVDTAFSIVEKAHMLDRIITCFTTNASNYKIGWKVNF